MSNTILLADDSVTIQKVTELTFMDSDFEVVAVSNGDDALARLATVNPDLVIADVHMPGADGYEVCRRTKEYNSAIPVLLVAGMFEPFDEGEASRCGADGHLKKPFDAQELLALVQRLHAERGGDETNELDDAPTAKTETSPTLGDETSELVDAAEETSGPVWGNLETEAPEMAGSSTMEATKGGAAESLTTGGPAGGDLSEEADENASEDRPFGTLITPTVQAVTNVAAGGAVGEVPEEPFGTMITPPAATMASPSSTANIPLSDDDIDRIARRIVDLLGDQPVREVAWEVIPDLAEVVVKERIRQLEAQAEG